MYFLQERFTSPWAIQQDDEDKFSRTVDTVGKLLGADIELQALYHMLLMMTPSKQISPSAVQVFLFNDNTLNKPHNLFYRKILSYKIFKIIFTSCYTAILTQEAPLFPFHLQDARVIPALSMMKMSLEI